MPANQPRISVRKHIVAMLIIIAAIIVKYAYISSANFIVYLVLAIAVMVCAITYRHNKL